MSAEKLDLIVSVKGEITKSNYEEFAVLATTRIESLNFSLTTDEEFGQAESDIKDLARFEKTLSVAEDEVLKQMDGVYSLIADIKGLKSYSAKGRLTLKKKVDSQKGIVRMQIKRDALNIISIAHPEADRLIEEAMKGKKTLTSLKSAAIKVAEEIEEWVNCNRATIEVARADHGSDIIHGELALMIMDKHSLQIELERRIERRTADRKAEKLRQEAEDLKAKAREAAKIQADKARAEDLAEAIKSRGILDEMEAKRKLQIEEANEMVHPPKDEPQEQTQAEELAAFIALFGPAFAPIREARVSLKHSENIEAGEKFAEGFGVIFSELKGGLK
jgi:hypothetical protein